MSPLTRSPNATAHTAAAQLAHLLAVPPPTPPERRWRAQSLAEGAAGIALLHVERAHAGLGGWDTAHAWLKVAAQADISAAANAGLYFGAPALAFILHAADADGSGRYARVLIALDSSVVALTHRRIDKRARASTAASFPGWRSSMSSPACPESAPICWPTPLVMTPWNGSWPTWCGSPSRCG